jgi:PPK2 family polyphosphate:nucleotide phosphotransferase
MTKSKYLVTPGKKFKLDDFPSDDTGPFEDKKAAEPETKKLSARLGELQPILYAEAKRSLLIIIQGMDTSGKDGAIRSVFEPVNPQSCAVVSFKKPTSLELAHDFLWRHHAATPPAGMIMIHNRSHYEAVLVERVRELTPRERWSKRFDHINDFERMLADEGTTILKFFLHISKDEQKERLEARLHDPTKNWKFDLNDLEERKHWDAYQRAYEDLLHKCSTQHAPWYVVPADKKWYRNHVMSDVIVRTLEGMDLKFPRPLTNIDHIHIDD